MTPEELEHQYTEILLTLAAERGDIAGALPGWTLNPMTSYLCWMKGDLRIFHVCNPGTIPLTWEVREKTDKTMFGPILVPNAPTAREAMRLGDILRPDGVPILTAAPVERKGPDTEEVHDLLDKLAATWEAKARECQESAARHGPASKELGPMSTIFGTMFADRARELRTALTRMKSRVSRPFSLGEIHLYVKGVREIEWRACA